MSSNLLEETKKAVHNYVDHYYDVQKEIKKEMDEEYTNWYPKTKEEHIKVINEIVRSTKYKEKRDEWIFDLDDLEIQYLYESLKTHYEFHDCDYDDGGINLDETEQEITQRIIKDEWKQDVYSQLLRKAFLKAFKKELDICHQKIIGYLPPKYLPKNRY